ncbi:hypothetical protein QQ965_03640 [Candidatus Saccharibacteria bacterium oral taxon 955]
MSTSGIEPTRERAARIMAGQIPLVEMINEGCLPRLRNEAKSRVADVFSLVTLCHPVGRRCRHAPENTIPGDEDLESLVGYIVTHIKRPGKFVRVSDLRDDYRDLSHNWRESVRSQARYSLVKEAVEELLDSMVQLWHHTGPGFSRWQSAQSLIDKYSLGRRPSRRGRRRRRKKYDRRPYHGRPDRDRNNGTVEGVSVGGCWH